jgi:hypothetical protein
MCESDGDLLRSAPGSREWAVLFRISISSLLASKGSFQYKSDFTHQILTKLRGRVAGTPDWGLRLIHSVPVGKYRDRAPN